MVEGLLQRRANADEVSAADILVISLQTVGHRVDCLDEKAQLRLLLVILPQVFVACGERKSFYPLRENSQFFESFQAPATCFCLCLRGFSFSLIGFMNENVSEKNILIRLSHVATRQVPEGS